MSQAGGDLPVEVALQTKLFPFKPANRGRVFRRQMHEQRATTFLVSRLMSSEVDLDARVGFQLRTPKPWLFPLEDS